MRKEGMKFSVIMPSYLGEYKGAASNRNEKIRRAIDSVLGQTYQDWELRIISDGCDKTDQVVRTYADPRIKLTRIEKRPLWCPGVRNRGLVDAQGEFVVYLDIDDYWTDTHLEELSAHVEGIEWGYFNALFYTPRLKGFHERQVNIDKCSTYGTANIVHRNIKGLYWPEPPRDRSGNYDYGRQDCSFVDELKKLGKGTKIPTMGYLVCHEPNLLKIDV